MSRKRIGLRALAMAVLALLTVLSCPALAEPEDVESAAVDPAVVEARELALPGDPTEDGAALPAAELAEGAAADEEAQEEGEELAEEYLIMEAGPDESGRINRIFDDMVEVGSTAWSGLNLKRAPGYSGRLARVSKKLTLEDILIEGNPASEVRLLDYFELAPGASIACAGGPGDLRLSLSAFSINQGANRSLSLKWEGDPLSNKKAKWYTSNKKVAAVTSKGKVTAKGKGTALITVKYKGQWAVCGVVVTDIVYAKPVKLNLRK